MWSAAIRAIDPYCIVVVLTAYPDVESAIEGIHEGVDGYIIKPANADTLVALLSDKLAKQHRKTRDSQISGHHLTAKFIWTNEKIALLQYRAYVFLHASRVY